MGKTSAWAAMLLCACGADSQAQRLVGLEVDSGAAVDAAPPVTDARTDDDASLAPESDAAVASDAGDDASDAGSRERDASVEAPEDAGADIEEDAAVEDDSGVVIIGPGPDEDAGVVPYFERTCPSDCPEFPEPDRADLSVETNICYEGADAAKYCSFFCTRYDPEERKRFEIAGRHALCERIGGECVYLDENGNRVPSDQELTTESKYCLPKGVAR